MHPSSFDYYAPDSLDGALELLERYGDDAKIMAGGQSLIPLLKLRLASFPHIIDISGIDEMKYIEEGKEYLNMGALTTISEIEESQLIKTKYRLLHEAATKIADPLVRNRGTIGGNISHGDPSNDMPAAMIALNAKFKIVGPEEERMVPAATFVTDSFSTVLGKGEILKSISIPIPNLNTGGCYIKQKKNAGDFSVAAIAVLLHLDEREKVRAAGIGLTSVGPKPLKAEKAEIYLKGKRIDDRVAKEAAEVVVGESNPFSDFYGNAEFKKKVLGKIAEDAIHLAYERAMVG